MTVWAWIFVRVYEQEFEYCMRKCECDSEWDYEEEYNYCTVECRYEFMNMRVSINLNVSLSSNVSRCMSWLMSPSGVKIYEYVRGYDQEFE